jgi:hypothetical protein
MRWRTPRLPKLTFATLMLLVSGCAEIPDDFEPATHRFAIGVRCGRSLPAGPVQCRLALFRTGVTQWFDTP